MAKKKTEDEIKIETVLDAHKKGESLHNVSKMFFDLPIDVQLGLKERITEYLESRLHRSK